MSDAVDRQATASTRLVCLLGHPVAHSRSPRMHNEAFALQGVDMRYLAFDVAPESLPDAISGMRALGVAGANVTIPHKEAVLPLLDVVDPVARRIAAVNTIVNEGGVLLGYNTDMHGFLMSLERAWGRSPRGSRCLVLGAGGSARAVIAGLATDGAAEIWVHNRTVSRARGLCQEFSLWSPVPCHAIGDSELADAATQADVIVNATTLGMGESVKVSPVPVDIVSDRHVIVDLVYGGEPTALMTHAVAAGAVCVDGLEMLVQQAARSYELWTGRTAPIEHMREVACQT